MGHSLNRQTCIHLVFVLLTGLSAYGLKRHYSRATPDELAWVLAPTAALVELASGATFSRERHAGFVSRELSFVIAPSCAGVNFLIIALCTLMLSFIGQLRGVRSQVVFTLSAALTAYVSTVVVNSLRIMVALRLRAREATLPMLDAQQTHRIEGVVVYVVCLYAIFFGVRAVLRTRAPR